MDQLRLVGLAIDSFDLPCDKNCVDKILTHS